MSLSWNEFKKQVGDQLKEQDIDPDSKIWYIDTSFPEYVEVGLDESSGITID